jgi:nitroreductase/dihydropteridine reductase
MEFIDIAKERYTTKTYDETRKVPEHLIDNLKNILRLSPSSINSQPWKFIFVSDEKTKARLAEQSYFNEQRIKESSHLVVFSVMDGKEAFERHMQEYLAEGSLTYYRKHLQSLSNEEIKSWLSQQVYLALGFFLGACASMGIDSTPMEGIQNAAYDKILNLKGHASLVAVAIGYRDKGDGNQPSIRTKSRRAEAEVIQTI